MDESTNSHILAPKGSGESPKVDIPAPKLVAFIGCLIMICEGILYLQVLPSLSGTPTSVAMNILAGITNLAAGIILFLVINVAELNIDIKIPYEWWLLMAIGGGVLLVDFIANAVISGSIFGVRLYWGGLLVAIGGMIEWHVIPEKLNLSDSKFVLLLGAGMAIAVALITMSFLSPWFYVTIGLCVLLILAIFDVAIPYEWWLILGVALAVFMLPIHPPSGVVLLVGYLLVQLDY